MVLPGNLSMTQETPGHDVKKFLLQRFDKGNRKHVGKKARRRSDPRQQQPKESRVGEEVTQLREGSSKLTISQLLGSGQLIGTQTTTF